MRREGTLEDISDGKLYTAGDMVKAGCSDCKGCSSCCRGMGNSLILDPYDICCITTGLKVTFAELLQDKIQLNMADGVILPNMAMDGEGEACGFLSNTGRCTIHDFRPGICRLFPLGRYYENNTFKYILQTGQCKKENRTKVKIKSFLGIENLREYERYINDWHYFIKGVEAAVRECMVKGEEAEAKKMSMSLLNLFYIEPYSPETFYGQYYERHKRYSSDFWVNVP